MEAEPGADEVRRRALRQLARLRFDLHDGPQQDIVLLAEDMRMLHTQLVRALDGHPDAALVLGHVDDLQARLVAVEGELRRISSLVESPFLHERSFAEAIEELVEAFTSRTGIRPELSIAGDFDRLSDSQQITLVALVRESLNNAREHSEAERVTVHLAVSGDVVEASITDDGVGFEPEETLLRAARDGHLGLVGMHERVQMLGGTTSVSSRPGGPTLISARLPAYGAQGT